MTDSKGFPIPSKVCNYCKEEYPDTFEFFHHRGKKTANTCKECNNKRTGDYAKSVKIRRLPKVY